jgi:hypothetical protein
MARTVFLGQEEEQQAELQALLDEVCECEGV